MRWGGLASSPVPSPVRSATRSPTANRSVTASTWLCACVAFPWLACDAYYGSSAAREGIPVRSRDAQWCGGRPTLARSAYSVGHD